MAIVKLVRSRLNKDGDGKVTAGCDVPFGPAEKPTHIYKFRPVDPKEPGGDQVAEVADEGHIATFLSIPDGFEVLPDSKAASILEREADLLESDSKTAKDKEEGKKMLETAGAKRREAEKLRLAEEKKIAAAQPKAEKLASERVAKEKATQDKLDRAAVNRQKRAKEGKGKGKDGTKTQSIASLDDKE